MTLPSQEKLQFALDSLIHGSPDALEQLIQAWDAVKIDLAELKAYKYGISIEEADKKIEYLHRDGSHWRAVTWENDHHMGYENFHWCYHDELSDCYTPVEPDRLYLLPPINKEGSE